MIYGTGSRVVIGPSAGANAGAGPLRYLDSCGSARDAAVLADLRRQLDAERGDADTAAWRRLEACLGYDTDEVPDGLIEALVSFEERVGESGVEEAAIAAPGAQAPDALAATLKASAESTIMVNLEFARTLGLTQPSPVSTPPWQIAEAAASQVRKEAGLPRGPIRGAAFADLLRTRWAALRDAPATARRLPYGARLRTQGADEHLALQTQSSRDRRFELARMVGDAIWATEPEFGVVGRARTDRQKFQRAFAQSLLCPFGELSAHIDIDGPTEEQMTAAARHFHVHPNVVRTLLVNKGVLPRETLGERLEAA